MYDWEIIYKCKKTTKRDLKAKTRKEYQHLYYLSVTKDKRKLKSIERSK